MVIHIFHTRYTLPSQIKYEVIITYHFGGNLHCCQSIVQKHGHRGLPAVWQRAPGKTSSLFTGRWWWSLREQDHCLVCTCEDKERGEPRSNTVLGNMSPSRWDVFTVRILKNVRTKEESGTTKATQVKHQSIFPGVWLQKLYHICLVACIFWSTHNLTTQQQLTVHWRPNWRASKTNHSSTNHFVK